MLAYCAWWKGYRPSWAGHKFHDIYGEWPPNAVPQMVAPSRELLAWIRAETNAWISRRNDEEELEFDVGYRRP